MDLVGGVNKISLVDGVVYRPRQPWSEQVQALLVHLEDQDFAGSPRPLGFAPDGREMVSYLPGETLSESTRTTFQRDKVLVSAARLLRSFHDSTVGYDQIDSPWYGESHPGEESPSWAQDTNATQSQIVVCHNDFAPYNCVLNDGRVTGVFDFDTAEPAPRRWDVTYAVFRFCPLSDPSNSEAFGSLWEQRRRLRLFCQEYGTPCDSDLLDLVCKRVQALTNHMRSQAKAGHEAFTGHIAAGHDASYEKAIDYIRENQSYLAVADY